MSEAVARKGQSEKKNVCSTFQDSGFYFCSFFIELIMVGSFSQNINFQICKAGWNLSNISFEQQWEGT